MHPLSHAEISKLTVDERLDLIAALWESLEVESAALRLTEDQKAELNRRLDDPNPGPLIPWEQVRDELRRP